MRHGSSDKLIGHLPCISTAELRHCSCQTFAKPIRPASVPQISDQVAAVADDDDNDDVVVVVAMATLMRDAVWGRCGCRLMVSGRCNHPNYHSQNIVVVVIIRRARSVARKLSGFSSRNYYREKNSQWSILPYNCLKTVSEVHMSINISDVRKWTHGHLRLQFFRIGDILESVLTRKGNSIRWNGETKRKRD